MLTACFLIIPLVAAFLITISPARAARWIGLAGGLGLFGWGIVFAAMYPYWTDIPTEGAELAQYWPTVDTMSIVPLFGIQLELGVNSVSLLLVLLTCLFAPLTVTASFTADSPYFSSYVDREMHSLNVLHDTVKDISARAQTFGRCGGLMAEATRRLSQACHLQPSGGTSSGPRSPSDDRGADADPEARDRELALREQRRNAVGSEMESVLSVLGGVSSASERSGFWAC